jgi:ATP-binding cassette subfamily C protein LapB
MGALQPDFLLSGVILNVLGMALPLAMLQIFDRIIPHAAFATLSLLVAGLVASLVCEAALRQLRTVVTAWEGARFDHRTSVALVGRILAAPVREVQAQPLGVHMERLNSIEPVRDFFGAQLSLLLADVPFIVIFLALIYFIAGWLVMVPIAIVAGFGFMIWLTGDALYLALHERKELEGRRYNFIVEVISNIHTVKSLAIERLLGRRYERLISHEAALGWRVNYLSSLSESFAAGFSQMTLVTVGGLGALLVINDQMSVGSLAAASMLAGRSVQPLLRTLGIWTRFQSTRLAVANLRAVTALPRECSASSRDVEEVDCISMEDMSFGYDLTAAPLFDHADWSIVRGETIGLTGANGSGKTTLLNLIMGNYSPTKGVLKINGRSIDEFDRQAMRRHIAYIPQRSVLFRGTVLDNLTNFDLDANIDQGLELAARLGLDRFFAARPNGYEMPISEGSANGLPTGVVQRIGMVRALVGKPQLILFDEANATLDQSGDKLVRDLLASYSGRAATVIVSFRPSLLAIADRLFEITDQRIVSVPGGANRAATKAEA